MDGWLFWEKEEEVVVFIYRQTFEAKDTRSREMEGCSSLISLPCVQKNKVSGLKARERLR